jgi:hypothetical protein
MQTIVIDSANVGHKLLSKMGWKAGKGLGAKESGKVRPGSHILPSLAFSAFFCNQPSLLRASTTSDSVCFLRGLFALLILYRPVLSNDRLSR